MLNEMLYVVKQIMYHEHWRPSGLKSGGALTKYVRGGTEKVEHKWWCNCTGWHWLDGRH